MIATDFPESNRVIDKPPSMTRDECDALNVWTGLDASGNPLVISCWKMTVEEREEFLRTGRIWCYHFGNYLQPHSLGALNPFEKK